MSRDRAHLDTTTHSLAPPERGEGRGEGNRAHSSRAIVFAVALLGLGGSAEAQVTYTCTTYIDAFLATGSSNNPEGTDLTDLNFGAAGTLVVAPAASVKGEFQSVLMFDLADASALFDTNYGPDNWTITGISLVLTSNYGTDGSQPKNMIFPEIGGGNFVIEWLSEDDWVEGTGTPAIPTTDGVTYDSLPDLLSGAHDIVCTNTYSPPGDNVPVTYTLPLNTNLVANITAGGEVTLLFYADDDQIGYLFNSLEYGRGNQPLINVTATANTGQLSILAGYFTNGLFHLTGLGVTNLQYQVQANDDLTTNDWETIGTVTADSAGLIQFDDTAAASQTRRFYRLFR